MLKKALTALAAFSALALAAEVNVYSHRHYDSDKLLFETFTKETGIKVNVVTAKANELLQRLEREGKLSPADVLITVDIGNLQEAKEKGLLKPVSSKTLESNIPAHLRDADGQWFGLTKRSRVIVYNKANVKPEALSTYEALTDAKWKGRVLTRSSDSLYNQSLLASLIAHKGEAAAESWAKGIVANLARAPKGNDRDQIRAVAAGEGDVALVNTYYLGLMQTSPNEADRQVAASVGVFFPNQAGRGAHINISGAGVTAASKNSAEAIKLIEFLASEKAQKVFAEENFEYPANPKIPLSDVVAGWGKFKEDTIALSKVGAEVKKTLPLFDRAGWR